MKKIFLLILAALFILPISSEAKTRKNKGIGIVAHRGFWNCEEAGYAQNSVAALRCAQEAGLWGSEFDVKMTADSVLIVYHDSKIGEYTIETHPYSRFKDMKLANGENIPTLDDYLIQAKKYPKTMLVYEFKGLSDPASEDLFLDLTIKKLKEHKLLNPKRVMFISFSIHLCRKIAEHLPGFSVQFLGSSRNPDELAADGINGVDYNHAVYTKYPDWYNMARKNNMSVNSWTVNTQEDMLRMFELGVDQITTDNPLQVRNLLKGSGYKEIR